MPCAAQTRSFCAKQTIKLLLINLELVPANFCFSRRQIKPLSKSVIWLQVQTNPRRICTLPVSV